MSMQPDPGAAAHEPRHLIGQMICDIAVGSNSRRFRDADHMAWTLRDELLPAVEEVLDRIFRPGRELRVEEVTVDIGDWPDAAGWPEIRQEFRVRLVAALEALRTEPDRADVDEGPPAAEFLAALGDPMAAEAMLARVERLSGAARHRLRHVLSGHAAVVREVAEGLSDAKLRKLAGLTTQDAAVVTAAGREDLLRLLAGAGGASQPPVERDWAEFVQWVTVLPETDRPGALSDLGASARLDLLAWVLAEDVTAGPVPLLVQSVHSDMGAEPAEPPRGRPGAVLLAAWRRDVVAFSEAVSGRTDEALAALVQKVLPDGGGEPGQTDGAQLRATLARGILGGWETGSSRSNLSAEDFETLQDGWRRDPERLRSTVADLSRDAVLDLMALASGLPVSAPDVEGVSLPALRERFEALVLAPDAAVSQLDGTAGVLAELMESLRRGPGALERFVAEGSAASLERIYREFAAALGVAVDAAALAEARRSADADLAPWIAAYRALLAAGTSMTHALTVPADEDPAMLIAKWRQDPGAVRRHAAGRSAETLAQLYRQVADAVGAVAATLPDATAADETQRREAWITALESLVAETGGAGRAAVWRRDRSALRQHLAGLSDEALAVLYQQVSEEVGVATAGQPDEIRSAFDRREAWVAAFNRLIDGYGAGFAGLVAEWRADPQKLRRFVAARPGDALADVYRAVARVVATEPVAPAPGLDRPDAATPDAWVAAFERLIALRTDPEAAADIDVAGLLAGLRRGPQAVARFVDSRSGEALGRLYGLLSREVGGDDGAAPSPQADRRAWVDAFQQLLARGDAGVSVPAVGFAQILRRLQQWRRDRAAVAAFVAGHTAAENLAVLRAMTRLLGVGRPDSDSEEADFTSQFEGLVDVWDGEGAAGSAESPSGVDLWRRDPVALEAFLLTADLGAVRAWVRDLHEGDDLSELADAVQDGGDADPESVWRLALRRLVEESAPPLAERIDGWRRDPGRFQHDLARMDGAAAERVFRGALALDGGRWTAGWAEALARRAADAADPVEVWRAGAAAAVADGALAEGWRKAADYGGAAGLADLVRGWRRSAVLLARSVSAMGLAEIEGLVLALHATVPDAAASTEPVDAVAARAAGAQEPVLVWRRALERLVSHIGPGGGQQGDDPLEGVGAAALLERWRGDPVRFEMFAGERTDEALREVWREMERQGIDFARIPGGADLRRAMEGPDDPRGAWRRFLSVPLRGPAVAEGPPALSELIGRWRESREDLQREWAAAPVPELARLQRGLDQEAAGDGAGAVDTALREMREHLSALLARRRREEAAPGALFDRETVDLAVASQDVTALEAMLAEALPEGPHGGRSPLLEAALAGATRSSDRSLYLAEVIRAVASGAAVDLEWISERVEAGAAPGGKAGDAADAKTGPAADWSRFVVELDRAPGQIDLAPADVIALLTAVPGRVRDLAGDADRGLPRVAALLSVLGRAGMTQLARALKADEGRAVAAVLWPALPQRFMAPALRDASMWRFVLLLGDGYFPRSGGVAGIVETALAWLARDVLTRDRIAAALLERLEGERSAAAAGPHAQVVTALKADRGAEAVANVSAEAETALTRAAGLVLLAPWLPQLFQRLGLVVQGGFRDEAALWLALDALNHVVNGTAVPDLAPRPLERLLCGLAPEIPVLPPRQVEPEAAEMISGLLGAVLSQWTALGNTSVDGLRESFLRRDGLISMRGEGPHLRVMPKPFDMLLDRLPWSFSMIKYSWMPQPLQVSWRNSDG